MMKPSSSLTFLCTVSLDFLGTYKTHTHTQISGLQVFRDHKQSVSD